MVGNPWNWGGTYHHASTAAEGAMRGYADVVRSAGAANLMNSQAAGYWEDARRKNIDNRVYSTEKYFEMRAINRAAREAERGPRPSMEDAIRYAEVRKPGRLSASELDPLTGMISWPVVLQHAVYQPYREGLEKAYAWRANAGFFGAEQAAEVHRLTTGLQKELKSHVNDYPPQSYIQAKKFVEALTFESQFSAG
jgi:hypothetical protein